MLISSNTGIYSYRAERRRFSLLESIAFLRKIGFMAADINFSAAIYEEPDRIDDTLLQNGWEKTISRVKEQAEVLGIYLYSSHLPFYEYGDPLLTRGEFKLEMTRRALEASKMLGAQWAVLHPSKLEDPEAARKATRQYLYVLMKDAQRLGIGIALENMHYHRLHPCSNPEELCNIVDEFGELTGICFDTGHANICGLSMSESLRKINRQLKVLHLHDNHAVIDEHLPPFLGTVDWSDMASALLEIGFTGPLNFEITPLQHKAVTDRIRTPYAEYVVACGYILQNMINNRRDINDE